MKKKKDANPPLTWDQVFQAEREEIAWRRKLRPGEPDANPGFTGLALSGGGIRSATFNLGVLEALKEMDLLHRIDYLSTVSGGGYIGAWLAGNARRGAAWLRAGADWRESIAHLRRHSNYLSPKVGLFSADTWNIWAIWSRNTILIQLLLFLTLAVVLMLPHAAKLGFDRWASGSGVVLPTVLLAIGVAGAAANLSDLRTRRGLLPFGQTSAQWLIAVPFLGSSFLHAAALWTQASWTPLHWTYSDLLGVAWSWWSATGIVWFALILVLSLTTLDKLSPRRIADGILTSLAGTAVFYAMACGILLLLRDWQAAFGKVGAWHAFTLGPSLVLTAFALTVVLMLGLLSRSSSEAKREWWSRLGAWLAIYAFAWLLLAAAGLYAPLWVAQLTAFAGDAWSAAGGIGWIATTIAGLLAGRSESTGSPSGKQSRGQALQELVARVAPVVFVAGLVAGLSSAVHALLLKTVGELPSGYAPVELYWRRFDAVSGSVLWLVLGATAAAALLYSLRIDINIFSLNNFYRNRLVRCYLGATRHPRNEQPFTGFDHKDDPLLREIVQAGNPRSYAGPLPIVNCSLNLGGSSDLALHTRHSASFTLTPLHAGSSRESVGYAPLTDADKPYYCGADGSPTLGQAISVSGAAASPNMGNHTSGVVAFLLTVFNVRLGWWFPNPSGPSARRATPVFGVSPLIQELFGMAGEDAGFLNLSDGGHFENLGIYELVRRRCGVIIACDAECDSALSFGSLGNVIRMCETDFCASIVIDVSDIRCKGDAGRSGSQCAIGKIRYNDNTEGVLIYLKSSLTGREGTAVTEYKASHGDFPHETTADQFFSEDQFESYRELGRTICQRTFRDVVAVPASPGGSALAAVGAVPGSKKCASFQDIAAELYQLWSPNLADENAFVKHAEALDRLLAALRTDPDLHFLGDEIFVRSSSRTPDATQRGKAFYFCGQLIQLMENVYLGLQLDDTWDHTDNSGWKELFQRCAKSGTFRAAWEVTNATYGNRFRHFCNRKLELRA